MSSRVTDMGMEIIYLFVSTLIPMDWYEDSYWIRNYVVSTKAHLENSRIYLHTNYQCV